MDKLYVLQIEPERLQDAADMLRHDGCYEAERVGAVYRLHCTHYTPARWASFLATPTLVGTFQVGARDYATCAEQARGFTAGLRLAQELLDHRLVEG